MFQHVHVASPLPRFALAPAMEYHIYVTDRLGALHLMYIERSVQCADWTIDYLKRTGFRVQVRARAFRRG